MAKCARFNCNNLSERYKKFCATCNARRKQRDEEYEQEEIQKKQAATGGGRLNGLYGDTKLDMAQRRDHKR